MLLQQNPHQMKKEFVNCNNTRDFIQFYKKFYRGLDYSDNLGKKDFITFFVERNISMLLKEKDKVLRGESLNDWDAFESVWNEISHDEENKAK